MAVGISEQIANAHGLKVRAVSAWHPPGRFHTSSSSLSLPSAMPAPTGGVSETFAQGIPLVVLCARTEPHQPRPPRDLAHSSHTHTPKKISMKLFIASMLGVAASMNRNRAAEDMPWVRVGLRGKPAETISDACQGSGEAESDYEQMLGLSHHDLDGQGAKRATTCRERISGLRLIAARRSRLWIGDCSIERNCELKWFPISPFFQAYRTFFRSFRNRILNLPHTFPG